MARAVTAAWQRQPDPRVGAIAGWGGTSGLVAFFLWIIVTAIGCVGDNDNLWRAGAHSRAGWMERRGYWLRITGPWPVPSRASG